MRLPVSGALVPPMQEDDATSAVGRLLLLAVGMKCYGITCGESTAGVDEGCACLRYARSEMTPPVLELTMRDQPMVMSGVDESGPLLVCLFTDVAESETLLQPTGSVSVGTGDLASLTVREMEILRFVALSWDARSIAEDERERVHCLGILGATALARWWRPHGCFGFLAAAGPGRNPLREKMSIGKDVEHSMGVDDSGDGTPAYS